MSYAPLKLDRIKNFEPARATHSILCMLTSHTTYIHTKTKLSIMKNSEKKPIPVFIIKIAIYTPTEWKYIFTEPKSIILQMNERYNIKSIK